MTHEVSEPPAPSRALVVEDMPRVAEALAAHLNAAFPGIEVAQAGTLSQARHLLRTVRPDLALLDIGLPDGEGTALLGEGLLPATCTVVMVTIFDDDGHLFSALEAGAQGYLLKDSPESEFLASLRGILSGQPPLSPGIARRILASFHRPRPEVGPLSPREREVLTLVAKGCSVRETAEVLGVRANTAGSYLKEIYRKLHVSSRAEATLQAARLGLISIDTE